ncbi:glutathione S-transferase family protein [Lysobacter sp. TY2-98]|uniref:glutathione S-transferase family protein n=1 Tax=Lysobacter sp. TY2-98 TaxID=2290922 RepID=UPI000E1FDA8D|nr:glutathione S-transferase family protein [Lysobacter sp. TY2-98]AXK72786.1 glutathione S-transferase family protein [Lysobacter sp. TY2-98]
MSRRITFFYAPHSRAACTLALLETLGADYDLHPLDLIEGTQRRPDYLAVNPLGKVPAIRHGDAVVTEQVAILIYLADLYADRGLTPALDDPLRGPYLRWAVFYAACFEPAITDRSRGVAAGPAMSSPYGDYDAVVEAIATQLSKGPYMLGERFTAVDVLWGTALRWALAFKLVPDEPVFRDYVDRVTSRPEIQRATALDTEHAAAQAARREAATA